MPSARRANYFECLIFLLLLLSITILQAAKSGLDAYTAKLSAGTDAEKAEAQIGVEVHQAMIKALE
jgi:hypothetical protein